MRPSKTKIFIWKFIPITHSIIYHYQKAKKSLAAQKSFRVLKLLRVFVDRVTAQKIEFSIKDFFSKCDQIRSTADLVTFTEEIFNGKLDFLSSDPINEDPQELQDSKWLLRCQTLFGFLVMVYYRVGNGNKFSYENFGLGRPHFYATSHLKIEVEVFFS